MIYKNKMYIYKTINNVNGKIYIGQSTQLGDKIKYYLGSGKIFQNALKKYGRKSFVKEVIDLADTQEELNKKEKYWIDFYDSTNPSIGYNLMDGGNQGGQHSEKTKLKMSESHKGGKNYMYGKTHTEDAKEKISKKAKNRYDENITNHPMYGKSHSKTAKEKMSANHYDCKGDKNPMYGKSVLDVWIKKYGKDEANLKWAQHNKALGEKRKGLKNEIHSQNMKGENNHFFGKSHTDETKEKIRLKRSKKILQIDENDNIVNIFSSIKEANKIMGKQINSALKIKDKLICGYKWKYYEDTN